VVQRRAVTALFFSVALSHIVSKAGYSLEKSKDFSINSNILNFAGGLRA
jgi:hypothetical protein